MQAWDVFALNAQTELLLRSNTKSPGLAQHSEGRWEKVFSQRPSEIYLRTQDPERPTTVLLPVVNGRHQG